MMKMQRKLSKNMVPENSAREKKSVHKNGHKMRALATQLLYRLSVQHTNGNPYMFTYANVCVLHGYIHEIGTFLIFSKCV
jgi:hypothetical protein